MKKKISLLAAVIAAAALSACNQGEKSSEQAAVDLTDSQQQLSYQAGYQLAKQMQRDSMTANADAVAQGVRDALNGADSKVASKEVDTQLDGLLSGYLILRQDIIAEERKLNHPNYQAGKAFLEENATKEGVVTTDSGLQYKVVKEGEGASPAATDTVEVHYHGTLVDGTVFDSSVERGETISFPLNRVISGWTEGLQLMKEGGKTIFYIPYNLAYGDQQRSAEIGPYSALIFEVELFKVNP
ncbi:FKBP-type peptidyl-prolyl cis-trans isomerase [Porticoccaceae bacterium LTM1]|nr:FKBP-type peptidyl-prolyl cis-trans isomerase [Porticoccaceae bacterium LTM1]